MNELTTEKNKQTQIRKISWKVRILTLIPVVVMMIVIFLYSAKTAIQSSQTSFPIAEIVLRFFRAAGGEVSAEEQFAWLETAEHIIRKLAHASEYAVLAVCAGIHLYALGFRGFRFFGINVVFCAVYAGSDEFHQLFVEGRSGQISDVGIDTAGAGAGAIVFLLLSAFINHIRKKADTSSL